MPMGKRKGSGDGEAAGTSAAGGETMTGEPMVDRADVADKAAEKNRKTALKATRRLARTLCVEFRDGGEEAGDETGEGSEAGPFHGFPSKKQARKLEPAQRDALVDRLSALGERVVALSSVLAHKHGGSLSNMEARSQTGRGGFAGTGMEGAGDTLKVSAAFVEVDMWTQLSAVSRRCCDEALSSAVDDDEPVALEEEEEEEEEEEAAEAATTKGGTAREAEPTGERTAGGKQKADEPKRTFKDWYLENFTDAFAEELEAIRVNELGGGQESSVTSLIDAILVGIDVIPQLEQELCLEHLG